METRKILFYYENKSDTNVLPDDKIQLLEYPSDIPHLIRTFPRVRDLKKFVKAHYENYELKRLRKNRLLIKKPLSQTTEHVYLLLEGESIRKLSWGINWQKAARIEQIEGDEQHLQKNESLLGFPISIQFGFNRWANCGLEYIAYSSENPDFFSAMQKELTQKYGKYQKIVDFRNLITLLKKGGFKNERLLTLFFKKPDSPRFSRFIKTDTHLTYRSSLMWRNDNTVILLYKKLESSQGERNKRNHGVVVEFLPVKLYEFFEESFSQLFVQT
ncbi:MAG: hypothetical protein GY765_43800 [bacterium]|nr:hypothetical protein [bacterium]